MPKRDDIKSVLVIGSGPIVIGQAAEFDYSGSQACRSLKEEGVKVILVNSNPATIQTDTDVADEVYIEPLTPEIIAEIIKKERPDGLLPTMGGQTGLNLAVKLEEMGILEKYGVKVIGTSVKSIMYAEDRRLFNELLKSIGEPYPKSVEVRSVDEALSAVNHLGGYPILCRASYCLGGTGSGIAWNDDELIKVVKRGLEVSMNNAVALDECVLGWKEIEYEVMRDSYDNCITICNMENIDPMGIHTGESIVVAPAQTLSDEEHQTLRAAAIKIIRALKIEGACNIQFAVRPEKFEYSVIEVNPRASRSSALASKATGYPIARVAAKIALGLSLDEILNRVTGETFASFEPALDYVVIKIPRWPFDKFVEADQVIGTQMKSTGEVMAIGRTFEEALQKAVRSLEITIPHLSKDFDVSQDELYKMLKYPTDKRLFYIYKALKMGWTPEEINRITHIDLWFLNKILNIVKMEERLRSATKDELVHLIEEAKKLGFSDLQIADITGMKEEDVRALRRRLGIKARFKMVDTCAAEFEAKTPYYYSTYNGEDEVSVSKRKKIAIIGGGPIRIGQGIEFDYCCVHASMVLREEGIESIIINNNPETVSTDYDMSDKLYFEPLTFEDVMNVIEKENPDGVILQFGGQTPINLALALKRAGVNILGTSAESIDITEDREKFNKLLNSLKIPQPKGAAVTSKEDALNVAKELGYPVLIRPSYVLSGRAMALIHDEEELRRYIDEAIKVSGNHPILIDKFLQNAIEVDVDVVADGNDVFIGGILEHIEMAGVHSGDAAMVIPPKTLSPKTISLIKDYTKRLAKELRIVGLMNIQYAVKDGEVYVLEVNPRASRTVPFVSKAIGVPLAKVATKVMLGHTLKSMGLVDDVNINYTAVKESVFPFAKLPRVDPVLGPEMKSTGEVMGIDEDFGRAYYKSQLAAGNNLPMAGRIFLSISRREGVKDIQEIGKRLKELGFEILATEGTAKALMEVGVEVKVVKKVSEGSPNIIDHIRKGDVNLIINTPSVGRDPTRDGYKIRRAAVDYRIPYITTIQAARAMIEAIEVMKKEQISVNSLNHYHKKLKLIQQVARLDR
ncbi:MAG: carbamoyl-phosphate synthase large subunit [Nitrososphaerales archaeon]|nr:carbamoyl-phosphate synthase large subunit [Nitrososphaerales archaeon]